VLFANVPKKMVVAEEALLGISAVVNNTFVKSVTVRNMRVLVTLQIFCVLETHEAIGTRMLARSLIVWTMRFYMLPKKVKQVKNEKGTFRASVP
jgi:hypothetical protein